jgi:hypothetical protein
VTPATETKTRVPRSSGNTRAERSGRVRTSPPAVKRAKGHAARGIDPGDACTNNALRLLRLRLLLLLLPAVAATAAVEAGGSQAPQLTQGHTSRTPSEVGTRRGNSPGAHTRAVSAKLGPL